MLKPIFAALILSATTATADLAVTFVEGAPKDRFILTNIGKCPLPAMDVTLDLGTAPAGLIFDVTGQGAGVEVFQPFEMVLGAEHLSGVPVVQDGDAAIRLSLRGLGPEQTVSFTIDVDDTGGGRQTIVDGAEIAGAVVRAVMPSAAPSAGFDASARAVLPFAACVS